MGSPQRCEAPFVSKQMNLQTLPSDWEIETGTVARARLVAATVGIPIKASWKRRELLDSVKAGLAPLRVKPAPRDAATIAEQWLKAPNKSPGPLELETFHSWLELEFFCIPVPLYFTIKPVSLDKCKKIFRRFNLLFVSSEHNNPNTALLTKGQNLRFRALHDWHHIMADSDASFEGECIAFNQAIKTAPKFIHWILFSEIIGQAAVAIVTGKFSAQKLVNLGAEL